MLNELKPIELPLNSALIKESAKGKKPRTPLSAYEKQIALNSLIPSFRTVPKRVDFDKISKLFTDRHAKNIHSRQRDVLTKLTKIFQDGFEIEEIDGIVKFLSVIIESIENSGDQLISDVVKFVATLQYFPVPKGGKPLKIETLSLKQRDQVLNGMAVLCNSIGKLIRRLPTEDFAFLGTTIIFGLLGCSSNENDINTVKIHFPHFSLNPNHVIIDQSAEINNTDKQFYDKLIESCPPCCEDLLLALPNSTSSVVSLQILKCLRRLSSVKITKSLLNKSENLEILTNLLFKNIDEDPQFFSILQILWNLLDDEDGSITASYFSELGILNKMVSNFEILASRSLRQIEKQKRNDFAMILFGILNRCPKIIENILGVGLPQIVYNFLVENEMGQEYNQNSLSNGAEDFEFKKILINIVRIFCEEPKIRSNYLESGILEFGLLYLGSDENNFGYLIWSQDQLETIQIGIIGLLQYLVPSEIEIFNEIGGIQTVVQFLSKLLDRSKNIPNERVDMKRRLNSLFESTLLLISTLSERGNKYKETSIFKYLLEILNDGNLTVPIWSEALLVCSTLCINFKLNRELFGKFGGVQTLISLLQFESYDPQAKERMLLAVVECVWGSICGNHEFEDSFITQRGVTLLLNLLENSTYRIKRHVLGCVCDLLENPKVIPHIIQWRAVSDCTVRIENLLIKFWAQEERDLGVFQGPLGSVVEHTALPLKGKTAGAVILREGETKVIAEIHGNLRAKIYSIFSRIGFEKFDETLNTEEKVKLVLISKYLDFKIGEVWEEIADELKVEGIRPVSPDIYIFNSIEERIQEKMDIVVESQNELIQSCERIDEDEEQRFYDEFANDFFPKAPSAPKKKIHTWKQYLIAKDSLIHNKTK